MVNKKKLLMRLKVLSDGPVLSQFRSYILTILLFLINIDRFLSLKFLRPKKPEGEGKSVGIFSIFRPMFWYGSIFEMQVNKNIKKEGEYRPIHILCKGKLPICDSHSFKVNKISHPNVCRDCRLRNNVFYNLNGSEVVYIDDHIHDEKLENIFLQIDNLRSIQEAKCFKLDDIEFGDIAEMSVCRYFLRLTLDEEHLEIYKLFLKSIVMTYKATDEIIDTYNIEKNLLFNGRYVVHSGPIQAITSKKLPFCTYERSEQEKLLSERFPVF